MFLPVFRRATQLDIDLCVWFLPTRSHSTRAMKKDFVNIRDQYSVRRTPNHLSQEGSSPFVHAPDLTLQMAAVNVSLPRNHVDIA